jgi:hypothetical protein
VKLAGFLCRRGDFGRAEAAYSWLLVTSGEQDTKKEELSGRTNPFPSSCRRAFVVTNMRPLNQLTRGSSNGPLAPLAPSKNIFVKPAISSRNYISGTKSRSPLPLRAPCPSWREGDQLLIPLERQSRGDQVIPVEVFFSSQVGVAATRELDLQLFTPKFDLPLENIRWRVYLGGKWRLEKWTGSLQFQRDELAAASATIAVQSYLESEVVRQHDKTKVAEQMLSLGHSAFAKGNPQEARRAFESAFELSQQDNAFNEDTRVQLHNLRLQEALVGLNARQSTVNGEDDLVLGKLRAGRAAKEANYMQQDAKQILDRRNTADDNAAYLRLTERLIQEQDAAVSSPNAIHTSIPEQGRVFTFSRSVAVDTWADLQLGLEVAATGAASGFTRISILALTACVLMLAAHFATLFRKRPIVTQPQPLFDCYRRAADVSSHPHGRVERISAAHR